MESKSELSRLSVEKMLIIAQLEQPFPHNCFSFGVDAVQKEVCESSYCDPFLSATVLFEEVLLELLRSQISSCALVKNLKFFIGQFPSNEQVKLPKDVLNSRLE